MATVIADVTRVDSLTEQFGRQRLEDGLARRPENFDSQLSHACTDIDVRFESALPNAWIIRESAPSISKHERHANRENKDRCASRNLQDLFIKSSTQRVSEVRIMKVVSNKRSLKRNLQMIASTSRVEKEFVLDKAKLNLGYKETEEEEQLNEAFDLSSSSDEELRDLFARCKERAGMFQGEKTCDRLSTMPQAGETKRKRNKICRGSLKKKIKISRPCLDLEKMVARRLEDLGTDRKYAENRFHPIHQV